MAFSDFDLQTACERFELTVDESGDLFSAVKPLDVPAPLRETLDVWAPMALAMNTEKARSEMIIAPILMTAVRLGPQPLRLFSGVTFDVDREQGLNGVCDFLVTRSAVSYFITHPVLSVFEAKKEDIPAGVGQCVAAMVAARLFNEKAKDGVRPIYGAVTTGSNWLFLKLEGKKILIDRVEYHLEQVGQILGILVAMES